MRSLLLHYGLFLTLLGVVACSSSRKMAKEEPPKSPVGIWDALVSGTPMGDIPLELVLAREGEVYSGMINAEQEKNPLKNVKIEDDKVSGSFYSSSYGMDIYFEGQYNKEADTIEGWFMDEFKFSARRKVVEVK